MAYCYERKYKIDYKENEKYIRQYCHMMKMLESLYNEFFFDFNAMYPIENFHDVETALFEFFGTKKYTGEKPTIVQTMRLYNNFSCVKNLIKQLNQLKKGK